MNGSAPIITPMPGTDWMSDATAANINTPATSQVDGAQSLETAKQKAGWFGVVVARMTGWIGSGIEWCIGALTLLVTLAALAVVPVLNLLSLGYLLEASGRVARSGRIRDGFVGVRKAAVFGRIIMGAWLVLWPARFVSGMWKDAELIALGSGTAWAWRFGLVLVTVISIWHLSWACLRGGKLRYFLWPAPLRFRKWLRSGDKLAVAQESVVGRVATLRLRHYFLLGLSGFVGGLAWLILPVGLLVVGAFMPPAGAALLGLLGGGLLFLVSLYLPFLQALCAAEGGRFGAMFEPRRVRTLFANAPIAFWFSLLITLLFALPLYLLKIEFPPRDIAWLPTLLFVVLIFPARLLTGWAVSRALRRDRPRHGFWRWTSRLGMLPAVGIYVLIVYLTQYLSWNGALSLIEQHAFLVPTPMLSL